jgi:hypothetical protein
VDSLNAGWPASDDYDGPSDVSASPLYDVSFSELSKLGIGWFGSDQAVAEHNAQPYLVDPPADDPFWDVAPITEEEQRVYPLGACQRCGLASTQEGYPESIEIPDEILARLPPPSPMLCTCPPIPEGWEGRHGWPPPGWVARADGYDGPHPMHGMP